MKSVPFALSQMFDTQKGYLAFCIDWLDVKRYTFWMNCQYTGWNFDTDRARSSSVIPR